MLKASSKYVDTAKKIKALIQRIIQIPLGALAAAILYFCCEQ
jgi:hypothetical protein